MTTNDNGYTHIDNLIGIVPDVMSDSIISHAVADADGTKTILFVFAAGQELSEHTSARPAILHFLSGEAKVSLGNDTFMAQANSWMQMPPHLPHSIYAETDTHMLLLMLGSGK